MKTFNEIQKEIENAYKLINKKKEKLDQLIDTYSSIKDKKEKVKQHKAVEKDMCKLNEEIKDLTISIKILNSNAKIALYNEPEAYQWFIVDDWGARLLQDINEIVYYNETLDMYLWGVTHFGTSWNYVLTNIKIDW